MRISVGLLIALAVTVSMRLVAAFIFLAAYMSLAAQRSIPEEDMVFIEWSHRGVALEILLALLLGVLAARRLGGKRIRWQTCALAGALFGAGSELLITVDFSLSSLAAITTLSVIPWSIGFVTFWAIVLRSKSELVIKSVDGPK